MAGTDAETGQAVMAAWQALGPLMDLVTPDGEAAHRTGRVLVVESHGIADGDPAALAEMNLRMLVLTGGRERTIDDYSALAAGAGLRVTAVHDITERHVIIECVPV
jgi:hypothetical protein